MSIFKKPAEREPKRTISMMVYGEPGCGKTTLALSAPGAVLIDFENGIDRVHYSHRVDSFTPTSWEDVDTALKELRDTPEIKTVVVDSVDRLMDMALDHVRKMNSKLFQNDGTPSQRAWGARKQLYTQFVSQLRNMGKNIIYVAHQVEDKRKVGAEEVVYYRPNISKSNAPNITTDLDMMGFMMHTETGYFLTFDPWGDIECKNSFGLHGSWNTQQSCYNPLHLKTLFKEDGSIAEENNFITNMINWNNERVDKERKEFEMEGGK